MDNAADSWPQPPNYSYISFRWSSAKIQIYMDSCPWLTGVCNSNSLSFSLNFKKTDHKVFFFKTDP